MITWALLYRISFHFSFYCDRWWIASKKVKISGLWTSKIQFCTIFFKFSPPFFRPGFMTGCTDGFLVSISFTWGVCEYVLPFLSPNCLQSYSRARSLKPKQHTFRKWILCQLSNRFDPPFTGCPSKFRTGFLAKSQNSEKLGFSLPY